MPQTSVTLVLKAVSLIKSDCEINRNFFDKLKDSAIENVLRTGKLYCQSCHGIVIADLMLSDNIRRQSYIIFFIFCILFSGGKEKSLIIPRNILNVFFLGLSVQCEIKYFTSCKGTNCFRNVHSYLLVSYNIPVITMYLRQHIVLFSVESFRTSVYFRVWNWR